MRVKIRDFSMAYEDGGRGLPLLLVHGFPLNRRMWAPQFEGLAGQARMIAPDLRGHGESQPVPGPYSMDMLAKDLAALLDTLKVNEPAVVCGLSMGGYITLAFYRLFPERVAGLVLAATRAAADSPEGKANRDKAARTAQEEGVRVVAAGIAPKMLAPASYEEKPGLVEELEEIMESTSQVGMIGALRGMKDRPDSTATLEQIHCPVMIIHGADDQIIPVEEARAMKEAIPQAQIEVIPAAGHMVNLEQPEAFNAAVRNFLQTFA